jgi:hypothetical protein
MTRIKVEENGEIYKNGEYVGKLEKHDWLYDRSTGNFVDLTMKSVDKYGWDTQNRKSIDTSNVEGNASVKEKALAKKLIEEGIL